MTDLDKALALSPDDRKAIRRLEVDDELVAVMRAGALFTQGAGPPPEISAAANIEEVLEALEPQVRHRIPP